MISDKTKAAREKAKLFGGKALQGTARQKEWAEKIRAEKLGEVSLDQAVMLCDETSLTKHSKFWIENRHKSGYEFGQFIELQKRLLKQYKEAQEARDSEAVASIAGQYNALTLEWGFID